MIFVRKKISGFSKLVRFKSQIKVYPFIFENQFDQILNWSILLFDGTTVENKGKLILTEIFPSVQKHDI